MHIALLGDSVFDNRNYTDGGPDVVTHLRGMLPAPWRASLVAIDGATTWTFPPQLDALPADASHLVLSLGGNDALGVLPRLAAPADSVAEGLAVVADAVAEFEQGYRACITAVLEQGRPTTLCTIYNGDLEPELRTPGRAGVALFNDVILRVAREHGLPVIELRHVCTEPSDFVFEVEPSVTGGQKVARAVARAVVA
jgi:hypothetical protein